jgi:hypothetical protein
MVNRDTQLIWEAYSDGPEYTIGVSDQFQDVQNEYLSPEDFIEGLNHEKIAPLIYRHGMKHFTINVDGIDPSVDGKETYYTVEDVRLLEQIATAVAGSGEEYQDIAIDIGLGKQKEFMVFLPRSGFTGEEFGDMKVFFLDTGGVQAIHKAIRR